VKVFMKERKEEKKKENDDSPNFYTSQLITAHPFPTKKARKKVKEKRSEPRIRR
jgi:hypothetical protein